MTNREFAEYVEDAGWEAVLCDFDPNILRDAALAEALLDAQEAFLSLLKIAPTRDAYGDDEDTEYFEDDYAPIQDLVDVLNLED